MIEKAFGLLEGQWRKLKYVDLTNLDVMPFIIVAACLLHNFILDVEGEEEFDYEEDSDDEDDESGDEADEEDEDAVAKRNEICRIL